jgi:hypothetical protein
MFKDVKKVIAEIDPSAKLIWEGWDFEGWSVQDKDEGDERERSSDEANEETRDEVIDREAQEHAGDPSTGSGDPSDREKDNEKVRESDLRRLESLINDRWLDVVEEVVEDRQVKPRLYFVEGMFGDGAVPFSLPFRDFHNRFPFGSLYPELADG